MPKIVLSEHKAKKLAEATSIELSDEISITIKPLALWSDEMMDHAKASDLDSLLPLLFIESDGWERFKTDGGTAALLSDILAESNGMSLGKLLDS